MERNEAAGDDPFLGGPGSSRKKSDGVVEILAISQQPFVVPQAPPPASLVKEIASNSIQTRRLCRYTYESYRPGSPVQVSAQGIRLISALTLLASLLITSLVAPRRSKKRSMDHSRDPCPWVALSDFGGAFCMGVCSSSLARCS